MKKFGKKLLVFALAAVMLCSVFATAAAETNTPDDAEAYAKKVREWFDSWFNVMNYHGKGSGRHAWDVQFVRNDMGGGGSGTPQSTKEPADLTVDDDLKPTDNNEWAPFANFIVKYDGYDEYGTVEVHFEFTVYVYRLFVNNVAMDRYQLRKIDYDTEDFDSVVITRKDINVYAAKFSWTQEQEPILLDLPTLQEIENGAEVIDNSENNTYLTMVTITFDFNELFPPEEEPEPQHLHWWKSEGFEWELTNEIHAYAVYSCKGVDCNEECRVEATVTQLSHGIVSEFEAKITKEEAPDMKERTDIMTILPVFGGFEWDTTNGVKAYGIYVCRVPGCFDHKAKIRATVTKVDTNSIVPKYKAVITAEQAPDGIAQEETKTVTFSHVIGPRTRVDDGIISPPTPRFKVGNEEIIAPVTPVLPSIP